MEAGADAAAHAHEDGTASRFYDDSVERARVLAPDEVYLTFGIQRQVVQGFSWLMSVYGLSERPEHAELLLNGQRGLRSVLFRGVRWSSVRKVLDFGCGYASDLISLAKRFPHLKLHGYTISAEQAAIDARRLVRRRGLWRRAARPASWLLGGYPPFTAPRQGSSTPPCGPSARTAPASAWRRSPRRPPSSTSARSGSLCRNSAPSLLPQHATSRAARSSSRSST